MEHQDKLGRIKWGDLVCSLQIVIELYSYIMMYNYFGCLSMCCKGKFDMIGGRYFFQRLLLSTRIYLGRFAAFRVFVDQFCCGRKCYVSWRKHTKTKLCVHYIYHYIYIYVYIYYYTLKTCGKPKHWTAWGLRVSLPAFLMATRLPGMAVQSPQSSAICLHFNTNLWRISRLAMFEDTGEYSLILSLEYPIHIPRPQRKKKTTVVLVKPKFLI